MPPRPRVFDDIVVIEMSKFSPVAFSSMILADLGADVIKVEPPLDSNIGGTALSPGQRERSAQRSSWINRNKRSLALDYRTQEGRRVLLELAARSDVLIEGFRPGTLDKHRLGYGELAAVNPRLVMCSLSGYGQDGPYGHLVGHDLNYLALAGVLDLLGTPAQPQIPLNLVADLAGGSLFSSIAIMAALHARARTGRGQYLDMSYLDGTVALAGATSVLKGSLTAGHWPKPGTGMHSGRYPYYTTYECKDGKGIAIGCAEMSTWRALCAALDRPDLISAGPSASDRTRAPGEDQRSAREQLCQTFARRTRDEWFADLAGLGTCVSKVNQVDELFEDEHLKHRSMVRRGSADGTDEIAIMSALHVTGAGDVASTRAPYRGEHTAQILAWLGLTGEPAAE